LRRETFKQIYLTCGSDIQQNFIMQLHASLLIKARNRKFSKLL
jgi:hypothetical protein